MILLAVAFAPAPFPRKEINESRKLTEDMQNRKYAVYLKGDEVPWYFILKGGEPYLDRTRKVVINNEDFFWGGTWKIEGSRTLVIRMFNKNEVSDYRYFQFDMNPKTLTGWGKITHGLDKDGEVIIKEW